MKTIRNMLVSSYRVVLVFCCTLLISRTVESFSSVLHVSRNLHIYSARSAIPSETVEGYTFAERTVNNVTVVTGGDATGKPKRTVVSKNPRDWTPYNFRDKDGEYDVPFINVAMW